MKIIIWHFFVVVAALNKIMKLDYFCISFKKFKKKKVKQN